MIFKNNKVLITGGLAFIGSKPARRLAELGAHVTLGDGLPETLAFYPSHLRP